MLSELLYRSEVDRLALVAFSAETEDDNRVTVTAGGMPLDELELRGPPIKAVTYHELLVTESDDGWYGRVIFDV